jgi:hypothetical protein
MASFLRMKKEGTEENKCIKVFLGLELLKLDVRCWPE